MTSDSPLLRLGISACLLGEMVRYNGGHKRDRYVTDVLSKDVEWVPICPEVEIGLGVPRPTIQLQDHDSVTHLVEPSTGRDLSTAMDDWSQEWLPGAGELHGFILQAGSPSCGIRAKVWKNEMPSGMQPGLFAAQVMAAGIPVIDEGRLRDPGLKEHFFDQAMAWRRWFDHTRSEEPLSAFQARNKFTFMSHSPQGARELGQLAAAKDTDGYVAKMRQVLDERASRGRHANVLSHIQGYLDLDGADKAELSTAIDDYRKEWVPLLVPLTLLRHHLMGAEGWILEQTYLDPYPKEWMLRGLI